MGNLTKRDLIVRISNETGMTQHAVMSVIDRLLDHLIESLSLDQTVELRFFGCFKVAHRKARVGRNPRHPEHDVLIPSRAVVKFKAGKELKAEVIKLSKTFIDGAVLASPKLKT